MLDENCKDCAFYNPEKVNECDFDYENIVICSVLQKKMKTEIREVKNP